MVYNWNEYKWMENVIENGQRVGRNWKIVLDMTTRLFLAISKIWLLWKTGTLRIFPRVWEKKISFKFYKRYWKSPRSSTLKFLVGFIRNSLQFCLRWVQARTQKHNFCNSILQFDNFRCCLQYRQQFYANLHFRLKLFRLNACDFVTLLYYLVLSNEFAGTNSY